MKRSFFLIMAGAVSFVLLTAFVIMLSKDDAFGTRINGNSVQNSEKYQMYSNSSAAKFEYELKDAYNSREEILIEIDDLNTCYKYFCDKKEPSVVLKATEIRDGLMEVLTEKIKAYPPSGDEILKSKKYVMRERIGGLEMLVYTAKFDFNNCPDNEEYKQIYEKYKADYEEAKKIEDKYKSGELTIDQVLSQLDIEYTGLPY